MSTNWSFAETHEKKNTAVGLRTIRPSRSCEILVVNRDPELGVLLQKALYVGSLASTSVSSEAEVEACLRKSDYSLVLVGIDSEQSIDLLRNIHSEFLKVPIVAIARAATPDLVREVLKAGALDFLFGSLDARSFGPRLLSIMDSRESKPKSVARDCDKVAEHESAGQVAGVLEDTEEDFKFICRSPKMKRVLEIAATIAPTDSTVLIQGESGTGKELIAKKIYRLSLRKGKPFVEVNCGALPENLLESQLFGHEKGSFTGAVHRQVGLFEIADQGTIFLDEIGEMSLDMQVKLLRVLQFREFRRIGGSQVVKVDVRVIAATNKDLKSEVERMHFRSDLYYRLNVIALEVPPLRERLEEVPALVEMFRGRFVGAKDVLPRTFSPEAVERLKRYRWAGNVRELENAVERLILLSKKEVVDASDLDEHLGANTDLQAEAPFIPSLTLDEVKKIHISNVLRENEGNKMKTARILKINVKTLYNLMKKLSIGEPGRPSAGGFPPT